MIVQVYVFFKDRSNVKTRSQENIVAVVCLCVLQYSMSHHSLVWVGWRGVNAFIINDVHERVVHVPTIAAIVAVST